MSKFKIGDIVIILNNKSTRQYVNQSLLDYKFILSKFYPTSTTSNHPTGYSGNYWNLSNGSVVWEDDLMLSQISDTFDQDGIE